MRRTLLDHNFLLNSGEDLHWAGTLFKILEDSEEIFSIRNLGNAFTSWDWGPSPWNGDSAGFRLRGCGWPTAGPLSSCCLLLPVSSSLLIPDSCPASLPMHHLWPCEATPVLGQVRNVSMGGKSWGRGEVCLYSWQCFLRTRAGIDPLHPLIIAITYIWLTSHEMCLFSPIHHNNFLQWGRLKSKHFYKYVMSI